MTIKESLNALSNLQVSNTQKQEKLTESKIINHITSAYKLDISPNAMRLLNNIEHIEIATINTNVLSYTQDLQLIKKN
jgi:hypothetical protein